MSQQQQQQQQVKKPNKSELSAFLDELASENKSLSKIRTQLTQVINRKLRIQASIRLVLTMF
jgi:hypothetical protein